MSENIQAFPVVLPHSEADYTSGMTLLDYFAGQAMISMVAGPGAQMVADRDDRYDETNWKEIVASNAYDFALAMLSARQTALDNISNKGK